MARNSNGPTTRNAHHESSSPLVATQLATTSPVASSAKRAIQMTNRCTMLLGSTPLTAFSPFLTSATAVETNCFLCQSAADKTAMYDRVAETLAAATIGFDEIQRCQVIHELNHPTAGIT